MKRSAVSIFMSTVPVCSYLFTYKLAMTIFNNPNYALLRLLVTSKFATSKGRNTQRAHVKKYTPVGDQKKEKLSTTTFQTQANFSCVCGVFYALYISLLISKLSRFSGSIPSYGPSNGFYPIKGGGGNGTNYEVSTFFTAGGRVSGTK